MEPGENHAKSSFILNIFQFAAQLGPYLKLLSILLSNELLKNIDGSNC